MRILVIGCGSIGTRRAKILAKMGHELWLIDADQARASDLQVSLKPPLGGPLHLSFATLHGAIADSETRSPDAALLCTPPDSGRVGQIKACADLGVKGIFVEKPVAIDYETVKSVIELAILARGQNVITMGACNLRFTPGMNELRKVKGSPRYGRFTMGQAAKYWNPNHKHISLILDSIHELDLARSVLGPIKSIRGRSSALTALVSVHHEGGWSQIDLNRVSDPPVRLASVESTEDGVAMRVKTDDGMYGREMRHFLDCVEKGERTCNPLEQAADTCRWALEVA